MRDKYVHAKVWNGNVCRTDSVYQYDEGLVLLIENDKATLPASYEVHFTDSAKRTAISVIGTAEDGVKIPQQLLRGKHTIIAYLWLHTEADDSETALVVVMPLIERPPVGDEQPDPEEESTLSQAITIYNQGIETLQSGVEEVRQIAAALPDEIEASLAEAKASGMFDGEDGYTPVRGVDYWTDEDQQVISDQAKDIAESVATTTATEKTDDVVHEILNSPSYKESIKGDPGKDGVSPIARINQSQYGATISIIDAYGTTTAAILHGAKGDPGPGVPAGGSTNMVLKKKTDSDYDTEWAEDVKGVSDVQVNGTSVITDNVANVDLSEYVKKTDYATSSNAGVAKVGSGLVAFNGTINVSGATPSDTKAGEHASHFITPLRQDSSTFYGLAKAAGDSTQSASDNAVGVYTDEAKAAIQQMLDVPSNSDIPDTSVYATKTDTVLETTLSRGRKANTTVGTGSLAFGNDIEASGQYTMAFGYKTSATGPNSYSEGNQTLASGNAAHAEGFKSIANGAGSHAEGSNTIANAAYSHVEGKYNIEDSIQSWPTWTPNTEYIVGDKVKMLVVNSNNETSFSGYICKTANNDAEFVTANWTRTTYMNYVYIIGNGTADDARSNAYALTWTGDGHYAGDVYVHSNADSTGGTKLATVTDLNNAASVTMESDAEDVDLDISDKDGNVILRIKSGHIYTKEFSSDSLDPGNNVPKVSASDATGVDLDVSDKYGNVIVRFKDGHIQTKEFDSETVVSAISILTDTVKKITDGYEELTASITYNASTTNTITITDSFVKGEEIWFHLEDGLEYWDYGQYASYYEGNTLFANNRRGTNGYFRHVVNADCSSVKITIPSNEYTNGTNLTLHVYRITGKIEPKVVTVKADGTGMFTTIRAAIDSITDANHLVNPYVIEVYPGTYNTLAGYSDEEIEAAGEVEHYTQTSMVGPKLTDGMSMRGVGRPDEIILTAELDPETWSFEVRSEISTLNIQGEGNLENMTIIGKYIRYCVHDDFRAPVNSLDKRVLRNLIFKGTNLSYYPFMTTYGGGMSQPRDYLIENCDFGYDLGIHSNSGYAYGCTIEVNHCSGCRFRIGDAASASGDAVNRVIVNDCNFQVLKIAHNDLTIPSHMVVMGTGNEQSMVKDDTGTMYRLGMIDLFPAGQTAGLMVKRASSGLGIEATSDSDVALGIVIGSDSDYSYVQRCGYIASNYLGLTGLAVGDYVTVDSSTHLVTAGGTSSNAVGVVKAVDSDGIAYIQLTLKGE